MKSDFDECGWVYFLGVDYMWFCQQDKFEIEVDIKKDFDDVYKGIVQFFEGVWFGVYLVYIYYINLFKKICLVLVDWVMQECICVFNWCKVVFLFSLALCNSLNLLQIMDLVVFQFFWVQAWVWLVLQVIVVLVFLLFVGWQWVIDLVFFDNYLMQVLEVICLFWLEMKWVYFGLYIFIFVLVFLFSFDKNVYYYCKWKLLLLVIVIVGGFFIVWDVFFIVQGVWNFNECYFVNICFFYLFVEEWLFFFIVFFVCVFIYECLNFYIKKDLFVCVEFWLMLFMGFGFLFIGLLYWGYLYIMMIFLFIGGFVFYYWFFLKGIYCSCFYLFYLVAFILFLIVNGVLIGGYIEQLVVIYNLEEYLGICIIFVLLDDFVYGFLLMFGVVMLFECWW